MTKIQTRQISRRRKTLLVFVKLNKDEKAEKLHLHFCTFFIKVIVLINELSQGRRNSTGAVSMQQKKTRIKDSLSCHNNAMKMSFSHIFLEVLFPSFMTSHLNF